MPEAKKILIKGAFVLTMDSSLGILAAHDILITGDVITVIEPSITPQDDVELIDATGCIITPGFIDCHHHMWQQVLRTVATDWTLLDYCVEMRTVYGSLLTPDDVYFSMYAAALNLLHNGVTTVLEHCHIINSPEHADAAVRALKDAQIRGTFCYGFYENPPPSQDGLMENIRPDDFTLHQRMSDAERVRSEHFPTNDPGKDLLTFGIAPNEPESRSIEQTIYEIEASRRLGARLITMHVAMGPYDQARRQLVQKLHDSKILGPDLVFSHGASFTDRELEAIRQSGAGIVATPDTETQMGMGYPVAFRARDAGCKSSLGIDITSNQGNDMVAQMRLALQIQRAEDNCKSIPIRLQRTTADVLRMGTMGGAEVMQLESLIGSLAPGKKADLVVFRCDDINTVPIINPVGTIVFNTSPENIDTVIVDGRIVKKDGHLIGVDWPKLRHELQIRSTNICSKALGVDREPFRKKWMEIFGQA